MKQFDTEQGARQWVRQFDAARAFNRLVPLEVEPAEDGWWAVNLEADRPAYAPRVPRTPVVPVK